MPLPSEFRSPKNILSLLIIGLASNKIAPPNLLVNKFAGAILSRGATLFYSLITRVSCGYGRV